MGSGWSSTEDSTQASSRGGARSPSHRTSPREAARSSFLRSLSPREASYPAGENKRVRVVQTFPSACFPRRAQGKRTTKF